MADHYTVIKRWRDVVEGKHTRLLKGRSVFGDSDTLYSYGHHFPLAVALHDLDANGYETGPVTGYLLNGDSFSVTTGRHQQETRAALENRDIPTVTVPFSALSSAGVTPRHVRIVHATPATYVYVPVTKRELRPYGRWDVRELDGWPEVPTTEYGSGPAVVHHTNGEYRYHSARHLLGEAVIADAVTGRHLLSGWDHQDGTYFLCALPRQARTVEDAYHSLTPDTVRMARAAGLDVVRQGDLFFIPVDLTTRDLTRRGGVRERMGSLQGTNHHATEVARTPDGLTFARGQAYHQPQGRRPDHTRRRLHGGKGWHLVVRNTVPLDDRATARWAA